LLVKYGWEASKVIPWSKGLPDKTLLTQLAEKFTELDGIKRFITKFTRTRHFSLF
jgi:hypothetical protein